jgi:hypothetical protein
MNSVCSTCGTPLLPGTSFCRQCGSAISSDKGVGSSELPTSIFPTADATTQRLDPRPTSERHVPANVRAETLNHAVPASGRRHVGSVVALIILGLVIAALIGAAAISRSRIHSASVAKDSISYPGAKTVLDITTEGGGRAVHLQTPDSLDKVMDWYEKNLRPDKAFRITSSSAVLKNDKTTVTIASEAGTTHIVIKTTRQ